MKGQIPIRVMVLALGLLTCSGLVPAQPAMPLSMTIQPGWQWPASSDGVTRIPVCWEGKPIHSQEKEWVQNAVNRSWGTVANLEFLGWGNCKPDVGGIRISVTDSPPISYVGKQDGDKATRIALNFSFRRLYPACESSNMQETCIRSTAVHMFGHALGYTHGPNQPDCYDVPGGSRGWGLQKDFRFNSIMNFCGASFAGDPLTELDVRTIRLLYGPKTMNTSGRVLISDHLESGQAWENILVTFYDDKTDLSLFFGVADPTIIETRAWDLPTTGKYCYRVWSYTMFANGRPVMGFGQGCLDLFESRTYELQVYSTGLNARGFLNLRLDEESTLEESEEPSQPVEPKSAGDLPNQNVALHSEFKPVFTGITETASLLVQTLRDGDVEIRATLNQIIQHTEKLREEWTSDTRALASRIYLKSLALDEALLIHALEQRKQVRPPNSAGLAGGSWRFHHGSTFKAFRGVIELSEFTGDAENALREANEDLRIKALYAARNADQWDALVDVNVNSKKGQVVVNGFEVWYVEKGWANVEERWKRFPQVSSPAREMLAPGNYLMRLASLDPRTKQRIFQEAVPQTMGADGKSLRIVDLLAR